MEKTCGMFFFSWPEALQAGAQASGGKGWNLGRLERYGFNVPAGGVLTAESYRSFMQDNSLLKVAEKISNDITVANIGEKGVEDKLLLLRKKIAACSIPAYIQEELFSKLKELGIFEKPLAVRSSATAEDSCKASFAGVHESYLNVQGLDNILDAIKACYASVWTTRAVAYRRKMEIGDEEVLPAVVIMELVEAQAAGVGFSCDPQTGREDIMVINANYGLGESVVSGTIEPDEYRVNFGLQITQKTIGSKQGRTVSCNTGGTEFYPVFANNTDQVLSDENIIKLSLLLNRVYDVLGKGEEHQDIEWVFDGKNFALVQARPVTSLPRYTYTELKNQPEILSNANLRDVAPMVLSTLNWTYSRYATVGIKVDKHILPGLGITRLYQGRLYWNWSNMQWMNYDLYGIKQGQMDESFGGFQPKIEINDKHPYWGIKGLKKLARLLKMIVSSFRAIKKAPKHLNEIDHFSETLLKLDWTTLTATDLLKKIAEIRTRYLKFWPVFTACAFSSNHEPIGENTK